MPREFIPKLIELCQKGELPYDKLVRFYDFEQIDQAIDDAARGAAIKPVIRMP